MTRNTAVLLNEIRQRGVGKRFATVGALNAEARTVELSFSSETDTVERFYGIEVLGHGADEVDLSRLNNAAPVLWQHNARDQRGVVESARIDADRVGRAMVRFGRSPEAEQLFQDVRDGIVTKVSVGYSVECLRLVEERADGTPVYRVTAWTPNEISMVSVPADDTVGVGRTAIPTTQTRSLPARAAGLLRSETSNAMTNTFSNLINGARTAQGDIHHFRPDGTVLGVTRRKAAVVDWRAMADTFLTPIPNIVGRPISSVSNLPAGQRFSFLEAALAASKVNQSGAHVFVLPEADPIHLPNGELGFTKTRHALDVVRPSSFALVTDGADVAETQLNLLSADIDQATMPSYAASHRLSRADQRNHSSEYLAALAGIGLAHGVSDLVDSILYEAILATTPDAFSLGAAAALGLGFADLRAIVGTNGDAAEVDASGVLRAAGVPAVLSNQLAETVIFAPALTGVALAPAMGLVAERLNLQSDLVLTAYANAQPLIVDAAAAWVVA